MKLNSSYLILLILFSQSLWAQGNLSRINKKLESSFIEKTGENEITVFSQTGRLPASELIKIEDQFSKETVIKEESYFVYQRVERPFPIYKIFFVQFFLICLFLWTKFPLPRFIKPPSGTNNS